ncbi:unnamed protein product, partial [Laminaria digitata]
FRTDEGVDISALGSGEFYIGWTMEEEYLRYTVDVSEAGETYLAVAIILAETSHSYGKREWGGVPVTGEHRK